METEPFKDTFGPKAQRKRPRLDVGDFEELSRVGAASQEVEGETFSLGEYITQISEVDPTLRLPKTSPPLKNKRRLHRADLRERNVTAHLWRALQSYRLFGLGKRG